MTLEIEPQRESKKNHVPPYVMIWRNGTFLLVAQEQMKYISTPWTFPRGRVKYGESDPQDLISLAKDFGLRIKVGKELLRKQAENHQRVDFSYPEFHVVYHADYSSGEFSNYDDFSRHRWVTLDEARRLSDLNPIVKEVVEKLSKKKGQSD